MVLPSLQMLFPARAPANHGCTSRRRRAPFLFVLDRSIPLLSLDKAFGRHDGLGVYLSAWYVELKGVAVRRPVFTTFPKAASPQTTPRVTSLTGSHLACIARLELVPKFSQWIRQRSSQRSRGNRITLGLNHPEGVRGYPLRHMDVG